MQILINDNNEIVSYAIVGGVDNAIEVDNALIPSNFEDVFASGKFIYHEGQIIENEAYFPPTIIEDSQPNMVEMLQRQNAQFLLNLAKQEANISKIEQQNASIILYLAQIGGENNVESMGD